MNVINFESALKTLKSGLPVIFQTDTLPAIGCLPEFADIIYQFNSSISGLKKIFKDYHNACSNYYESIKDGSVEKIEGIEKVRRKIHDDGARDLSFILNKDFIIDENTSRRLFTLMYSLYI